MITLSPAEFPVDTVITDNNGSLAFTPRLPVEEVAALMDTGLATDENGEAITDTNDPEIPFGWHIIEADDMSFFE